MITIPKVPGLQNMLVLPIFAIYCYLVYRDLRKNRVISNREVLPLMGSMIFFAFLGGRLWFAIFEGDTFSAWYDFFNPMIAGWVSWGVMLGGTGGIFIWFLKNKKDCILIGTILDGFALYGPLFTALYYITSIFHGSGVGKITGLPWAITYTGWSHGHHPTQVYTVLGMIIFFLILYRFRNKISFYGELTLWFLIGYGLERFCIDFLRIYSDYLYHAGLVLSQWVCIFIIIYAIIALLDIHGRIHGHYSSVEKNTKRACRIKPFQGLKSWFM